MPGKPQIDDRHQNLLLASISNKAMEEFQVEPKEIMKCNSNSKNGKRRHPMPYGEVGVRKVGVVETED